MVFIISPMSKYTRLKPKVPLPAGIAAARKLCFMSAIQLNELNTTCGEVIWAIPDGFQYKADASATCAEYAPPIPSARLPTPILRKFAAEVPTLSN